MRIADLRAPVSSRPRALLLGSYRHPLGLPGHDLESALSVEAEIVHIRSRSPLRDALITFRRAARAARSDGAEMVHVLDPRYALVGLALGRRYGIPVSAAVSSRDIASRSPLGRIAMRALDRVDHAFTSEDAVARHLAARGFAPPLSIVPAGASALPWPTRGGMASIARALRGVRPGRLVIGVPWPENRNDLRWFRDAIVPLLDARPVCLLLGAPNRRQARLLVGAAGVRGDFRVHTGRLDGDAIAAAARCVDAFVVCASEPPPVGAGGHLAIALATGGVPVVTNAESDALVLAHERNAFVVDPGDARGFAHALNQMLALPAVQRHFLGQEFARFTLDRWPWSRVAAAYGERFAALVGRPQIPADLRAA